MSDEKERPKAVLVGVTFEDLERRILPDCAAIRHRLGRAAAGVRGVESGFFLDCLASMFAELHQKVDKAKQDALAGHHENCDVFERSPDLGPSQKPCNCRGIPR